MDRDHMISNFEPVPSYKCRGIFARISYLTHADGPLQVSLQVSHCSQ